MSSFDSTVIINDKDKIKKRLLDLFNDVEELKKLFNCALPQNSLLKSILKIDEYTDKNKLCEILVNYFGEHFFVYISKIKSDDNEDKTKQKSIVWAIREKILTSRTLPEAALGTFKDVFLTSCNFSPKIALNNLPSGG